ncbi:MAG: choice-of-anchor J domain-containing protein, partial [Muribaculaceae bacterium]|nr:choice-of-anchor J domain-containing protein [Muribaculaceae bacterium]
LYAISKGADASLYRINKNSGDLTFIGSTGLSTDFAQSMTFDPITGKLYWAAVRSNGVSGLYEVDTKTGLASLIFTFDNNEEFTGLYIPTPEINESAPAAVTEIIPSFVDGSLSGTVTVTAPEKAFNNAELNGNVSITVLADGENPETREVAPGEKVSLNYTLTEGIHSFTAFASNASGEGPRTAKAVYVGIDGPAAVDNLSLTTTDDGKAHLSWNAPTKGRNEGYIDPSQLTYTVKRYPDNVVVAKNITATYFTDPVDKDANNYWFEVIPYCGDREGIATQTESGIFGHGTGMPCHFSLDSKEEFDLFTVIDANNDWDGQYYWGGWMYGPDFKYTTEEDGNCAVYGYHPETAADDWLITPPVGVEKGKKYRLTYTFWTRGQAETLEVTAGPQNTVAAQKPILAKADYKHKDHQVFNVDFTAEADGNYYIGFHITSKKKMYYAFISDIKVDAVPDEDAPQAVSDLKVVPGANGATEATLSFNAPEKTIGGAELAAIDKIEIFHGTESTPVATLQGDPGEDFSWTEQNVSGFVSYRVVPYANGKAGAKSEATVYVGWDIPLSVTEAEVSDASGKPVVTWTAPVEGINGGYIDPSKLTYAVYRYEDDLKLLERNVSGTSFTDTELETEPQHLVAYVIVAHSEAGYGEPASTDYIVFGDPYTGQFLENFADASVHSTPW